MYLFLFETFQKTIVQEKIPPSIKGKLYTYMVRAVQRNVLVKICPAQHTWPLRQRDSADSILWMGERMIE